MSLSGKNKRNWLAAIGIAAGIVLDLGTKRLIFDRSLNNQLITPVINPWAAWSLDVGAPLILAVTILACIAFVYLYRKNHIGLIAFIMLAAGALGNLYDRIVFNGVRDRIHISIFPVFNIADIMITIGVILIAWQYKQSSRSLRAKN